MEKEKLLALIYKNCKVSDIFESAENWVRQGWNWQFREKNKDIVVILSVDRMLTDYTDERFNVAGKMPAKVIRVRIVDENDENAENNCIIDLGKKTKRKHFNKNIECDPWPRKIKRDLLEEFQKVKNDASLSENDEARVLKPDNQTTPTN